MAWSAMVFGWPAVVCALIVFAGAFLARRPPLALVAALIAAPFCLLVSGYPVLVLRIGGLAALMANFGAGWLLYRHKRRAAAVMLIPFVAVAAAVAFAVANQTRP